jgi:ATP-dependent DNA helicase PIF1
MMDGESIGLDGILYQVTCNYTFKSADKVVNMGGIDIYPTEYLNTIDVPNLPSHELNLKVGALVILLRNLDPSAEMCNGTRMRVARCEGRVVECEIFDRETRQLNRSIPQMPMAPSSTAELLFEFPRTQFPLRVCFRNHN